jgi:Zn-dependent peptidase ImmA (M78 family)/transcriptional regulator with XRE-family HTH domain
MHKMTTQTDLFELPICPERLRRAREMRGFTQSDLARAAEVDQSHVAVLESGSRQPSPLVLTALARILDLPTSYFRQPVRAYLSGGTLRYRARTDLGKRGANRIRSEAEHFLELVLTLAERVNLIPTRFRPMPGDPIEAAREFRLTMQSHPIGPLPHLIRNFEKLGGIVIALGPEERFDAFAEWGGRAGDLPVIGIADGVSPDRLRMNVAHEIGHLVLHRGTLIPEKVAEREAFSFASALLMPQDAVSRDLSAAGPDLDALMGLKQKWGVSLQALVRRSHDLSVISDGHYRSLNARISKLGWKYEEPAAAERFSERPLAVRKIAESAFGTPLPFGAMERALHIPESQLRRFFSRYTPSTVNTRVGNVQEVSRRVH